MRAFLSLFLLFTVLELYIFFEASNAIGLIQALLLIMAGSMLGIMVIRIAGLATAFKARESLDRGELPAKEMLDGMILALGGCLMVFPGVISDMSGLLLLLSPVRCFLADRLRNWVEEHTIRQRAFTDNFTAANQPGTHRPLVCEPHVIEGEFEHRDT